MKHHRYPPTYVYNDARGLGRQMLDHDPNRTTNIRLLDILRGHLRDVVCRDARRWLGDVGCEAQPVVGRQHRMPRSPNL